MKSSAKICFLTNSMIRGGTERVLSILLKNLSQNNREFFLIILEDKFKYEIPRYEVPKYVKVIKFFPDLQGNFKKFLGIFLGTIKLRKFIKKNQINLVMSFLERSNYINILAKILGSQHKVYISERSNPLGYYSDRNLKSIFSLFFIKKLYKKADLISTNSLGVKDVLIKNFSINQEKIKVIPNPLNIKEIQTLYLEPLELRYQEVFNKHKVIINIGSLNKMKGQNYLIKAFKEVKKEIPETKLLILGKGELETHLKNLVRKLNLENDVLFLGWKKNPFKYLARAEVFVLSSLTEGFPNVLIEAMACKIPVISTDCPSGPNEIIENEKNGILVPPADEKALAKAMLKILNSPSLRKKFSQESGRRVQDFSVENIINKYEQILSGR